VVGQEVNYTVDEGSEKPRAKSVTPGAEAGSRTGPLQNKSPQSPARHKPAPRRIKLEFGFVTKMHRKQKQGYISANGGGKELQFDAHSVTGEKSYFALQIGDYVRFTRHSAAADTGPIAKDVQVTERKIRVDTGLDLPNHPRARRRKPSWR
jgi:cold shock CspA family protein